MLYHKKTRTALACFVHTNHSPSCAETRAQTMSKKDCACAPSWTNDEDELLLDAIARHGTRWSVIQLELPTRTCSAIRNRHLRLSSSDNVNTCKRTRERTREYTQCSHNKEDAKNEASVSKSKNTDVSDISCMTNAELVVFHFPNKNDLTNYEEWVVQKRRMLGASEGDTLLSHYVLEMLT